jgi:hypothetical protein
MATPPRFIVINGHSNAGKTDFCKWLAGEKNFEHIEVDADGLEKSGLREAWDAFYAACDPGRLLASVREREKSVVMDWPFNPPNCFEHVTALRIAGVPAWWFDADRGAAHLSFVNRAETSKDPSQHLENFILHASCVDAWRGFLPSLYASRYVQVLHPNGQRIPKAALWDIMCRVEGWS